MPFNQSAPAKTNQPMASFDRLGLPVQQHPSAQPAAMEQVAL